MAGRGLSETHLARVKAQMHLPFYHKMQSLCCTCELYMVYFVCRHWRSLVNLSQWYISRLEVPKAASCARRESWRWPA